MGIKGEYETRKKAIDLYQDGMGFMEIIRAVHRSGFWMAKWLRRYRKIGLDGLRDQSRGPKHVPTSEKILARAGKTKKVKVKRTPGGPPYPYVPARKMGDLHQTDLVGPRYLRGPRGVTRFYSFHTIDVIAQTAS